MPHRVVNVVKNRRQMQTERRQYRTTTTTWRWRTSSPGRTMCRNAPLTAASWRSSSEMAVQSRNSSVGRLYSTNSLTIHANIHALTAAQLLAIHAKGLHVSTTSGKPSGTATQTSSRALLQGADLTAIVCILQKFHDDDSCCYNAANKQIYKKHTCPNTIPRQREVSN